MSYDEHKEARLELAEARAHYAQSLADVQAEYQKAAETWDLQRERMNRAIDRARMERAQAEDAETEAVAERDALRAQVAAVRALAENARKHAGGPYTAQVDALSIERALSSSEPVTAGPENAVVVEEWAVDLGFTIARVEGRDAAERWVQSHRDHPDPDVEQMPVAVRRTVTTTTWLPAGEVTPPAEQQAFAHESFTHLDGSQCIWLDGDWFVPLDVGGEGYPCEKHHPARPTTEGGQP